MNPFGLFIVVVGALILFLGVTGKATGVLTHVKSQAGTVVSQPSSSTTGSSTTQQPIVVNGKVASNSAPKGASK